MLGFRVEVFSFQISLVIISATARSAGSLQDGHLAVKRVSQEQIMQLMHLQPARTMQQAWLRSVHSRHRGTALWLQSRLRCPSFRHMDFCV